MAGSFGRRGIDGSHESLPPPGLSGPGQQENPVQDSDEPRSVLRLVRASLVEATPDVMPLDQKASDDVGIQAALRLIQSFDLDLSPLYDRIHEATDVIDVYHHMREYAALVIRCLEVGEEVAVLHPDEEMRKIAMQYAAKHSSEKDFLILKLRQCRDWLKDQQNFEKLIGRLGNK